MPNWIHAGHGGTDQSESIFAQRSLANHLRPMMGKSHRMGSKNEAYVSPMSYIIPANFILKKDGFLHYHEYQLYDRIGENRHPWILKKAKT